MTRNGRRFQFDDYSYVGFELGTKPPGSLPLPCRVVEIVGQGDITTELQQKIEELRSTGGVIRLPPGKRWISATVYIPYANISIEGSTAGERSVLGVSSGFAVPRNHAPYSGVFVFGRGRDDPYSLGWLRRPSNRLTITDTVSRGSTQVRLATTGSIASGRWIVIQQRWPDSLRREAAHGGTPWPAGDDRYAFTFLRRVIGSDANTGTVRFDCPIPVTLDRSDEEISVWQAGEMVENVGLAHLDIEVEDSPNDGGAACYMERVRNAWVYDVHIRNFSRYGVYLLNSARVSVVDCSAVKSQTDLDGGYGYGFFCARSQNVLIRRCQAERTRHNFLVSRACSFVTLTRCRSMAGSQPDDTHHSLSGAICFDCHDLRQGAELLCTDRGSFSNTGGSDQAYETLFSGACWNLRSDGVRRQTGGLPYGAITVRPIPTGFAVVVGGPGRHRLLDNKTLSPESPQPGVCVPPLRGLQTGPSGNVLYENVGYQGLQPESLYEALLATRVTRVPDFRSSCQAPAPSGSFTDDFEGTALNAYWSAERRNGRVLIETGSAHSGLRHLALTPCGLDCGSAPDVFVAVRHRYEAPVKGTASIYYRDSALPGFTESALHYFSLYNSRQPDVRATLAADTGAECLLAFFGQVEPAVVCPPGPTPLRQVGRWRQLTISFDGAIVTLSIDGQRVSALARDWRFDTVEIGIRQEAIETEEVSFAAFDDFSISTRP